VIIGPRRAARLDTLPIPMTRLPNFVYLGPEKSGTSWLHVTLSRHPQVYLTPSKDLFFFNRFYDRGLDWYREQFAGADSQPVVGEIAHRYLTDPTALARMRGDLGEIKLMTTVRNPVDRAWSGYLYYRKHGVHSGSFREALTDKEQLINSGRYATAIARVLQHFPKDALYVAVFDDLEQDPQGFVDGVTGFLGVDAMPLSSEDRAPTLPAARARSTRVAKVVRAGAKWTRRHGHPRVIATLKRSPMIERALYRPVDRSAERPDPADVDYIKAALLPEVESLDRDFGLGLKSRWGW
jgi:Sulfotransferase domain